MLHTRMPLAPRLCLLILSSRVLSQSACNIAVRIAVRMCFHSCLEWTLVGQAQSVQRAAHEHSSPLCRVLLPEV